MSENAASHIIIAIDGPAGAGKSTVAARIAAHFGLLNLETGAMYRAFALKAIESDADLDDAAALERLAAATQIRLEPAAGGNRVYLDRVDVTRRIREQDVTAAASRVSVHPGVRRWLADLQRKLGVAGGIVMEGRDIGTAIFPSAEVKIFLDAAAEVRGRRRYQQGDAGVPEQPAAVLQQMRERDERDRSRADSPLRAAPDAIVIDSTQLSLDEVVARVEAIVTERLAGRR